MTVQGTTRARGEQDTGRAGHRATRAWDDAVMRERRVAGHSSCQDTFELGAPGSEREVWGELGFKIHGGLSENARRALWSEYAVGADQLRPQSDRVWGKSSCPLPRRPSICPRGV